MEARKSWMRESVIKVPYSQVLAVLMRMRPRTACQVIHRRKLPSWPSQKQEAMYSMGMSSEEWRQT